jgi:putative DNA-invertase from lambdoid prophage Rac
MTPNTFSKDMKRAAIYCRVSTDDQSCERQERDLRAFATRAGYEVIEVFKDTASGKRCDREGRTAILSLAQSRQIDAVLVTELTRWGRSTVDLLNTLQTLNQFGVSVVAERGSQFDLTTAQGKMIAGVLAVLAEFERDLIAERTKSGLATAKANGKTLGRPKGNRTDSKHRDAVLELTKHGFSIRDIASKLKIGKDTVSRIQASCE